MTAFPRSTATVEALLFHVFNSRLTFLIPTLDGDSLSHIPFWPPLDRLEHIEKHAEGGRVVLVVGTVLQATSMN